MPSTYDKGYRFHQEFTNEMAKNGCCVKMTIVAILFSVINGRS